MRGEKEFRQSEVHVHVLTRADGGADAEPFGAQVLRDGGGEVAAVGVDGHGALLQGLARSVATQGTADAHLVPGVGHAQAVATHHIHAGFLAKETDVARIRGGHLLGDDEDAFQVLVVGDQFADGLAHGRGRQVDDAGVEGVAALDHLAHAGIDRDGTQSRLQLAFATVLHAGHHVPARVDMGNGRHLAAFVAHDVDDAHPGVPGYQLLQGIDTDEEIKRLGFQLSHFRAPIFSPLRAGG